MQILRPPPNKAPPPAIRPLEAQAEGPYRGIPLVKAPPEGYVSCATNGMGPPAKAPPASALFDQGGSSTATAARQQPPTMKAPPMKQPPVVRPKSPPGGGRPLEGIAGRFTPDHSEESVIHLLPPPSQAPPPRPTPVGVEASLATARGEEAPAKQILTPPSKAIPASAVPKDPPGLDLMASAETRVNGVLSRGMLDPPIKRPPPSKPPADLSAPPSALDANGSAATATNGANGPPTKAPPELATPAPPGPGGPVDGSAMGKELLSMLSVPSKAPPSFTPLGLNGRDEAQHPAKAYPCGLMRDPATSMAHGPKVLSIAVKPTSVPGPKQPPMSGAPGYNFFSTMGAPRDPIRDYGRLDEGLGLPSLWRPRAKEDDLAGLHTRDDTEAPKEKGLDPSAPAWFPPGAKPMNLAGALGLGGGAPVGGAPGLTIQSARGREVEEQIRTPSDGQSDRGRPQTPSRASSEAPLDLEMDHPPDVLKREIIKLRQERDMLRKQLAEKNSA